MANPKVYFIWVGQGDCTLIRTDSDKLVLIDCGTSDSMDIYTDNVKPTIESVLSDTGKSAIDYLILTHSDKDHCNLVKKLFEFTSFGTTYYGGHIDQYRSYIFEGTPKKPSPKLGTVETLVPHYLNLYATAIIDDTDFKMWIIGGNYPYSHDPPDTPFAKDINKNHGTKKLRSIYDNNGNSLVVVIDYKGFRMMFLGDATDVQQQFLYDQAVTTGKLGAFASRMLKLSHHGSPDSYNDDLANKAVKPTGVTASAGVTFGHPSEQVINGITSVVKSGAPKHDLVMYNDDDDEYSRWFNVDEYIYNTLQWFDESSITVPTHTTSGKRSRDKHAGDPYLEMTGSNWIFEITSGTTAKTTKGSEKVILTTKKTSAVNAKKRRTS